MTDGSKKQSKTASRKPLWLYLKQSVAHLWRGILGLRPLWIGMFALVAISIILVKLGCGENYIRLLGMALQLCGVVTVAMRLRGSGRLFRKPTIRERIALYFDKFPRRHGTTHILSAKGMSATVSIGRVKVRVSPSPDTPLERRVEMLEEKTNELFVEVDEIENNLRKQSDELTLKITEEITERKAGHRAFEEQLERAFIGDIHVDWWGVIFFIAGIILASLSPELAFLLWNFGICGE